MPPPAQPTRIRSLLSFVRARTRAKVSGSNYEISSTRHRAVTKNRASHRTAIGRNNPLRETADSRSRIDRSVSYLVIQHWIVSEVAIFVRRFKASFCLGRLNILTQRDMVDCPPLACE